MTDRLYLAFQALQDKYLRDPALTDPRVRVAHVAWLREEQARLAGRLWDEADHPPGGLSGVDAVRKALDAHTRAEDLVIEREVIGRLPTRFIHELRNGWAYREAEFVSPIEPCRVDTGPDSTQHWYRQAHDAAVTVERVGNPHGYSGADPIEDVALSPEVEWTEVDRKGALEKAITEYGLEPGQWIDIEWPPTASLAEPGNVYVTDFEQCAAHSDVEDAAVCDVCQDCKASEREVVERMAQWRWMTTVRIHQIGFGHDGEESDFEVHTDNAFEVATIEQDPRDIVIGPPGAGRNW